MESRHDTEYSSNFTLVTKVQKIVNENIEEIKCWIYVVWEQCTKYPHIKLLSFTVYQLQEYILILNVNELRLSFTKSYTLWAEKSKNVAKNV